MRQTATVNYHVKSPSPQAFRFDVGGKIGNLVSPELETTRVDVQDLRHEPGSVTFQSDGVSFEKHTSAIKDFEGSGWRNTYDAELASLLKKTLGVEEVVVFDHTVRVDDATAERKPARNVHNDYSEPAAQKRLVDILGESRARMFSRGRYAFVNVWRPVENAITTSPLGFIRPSSVSPDDWMPIELIYPDRRGQILGVAANQAHEWFYLSHMTPDEVAIFNIYDSAGRPFLGHSALDMPGDNMTTVPRKSIESRTLVRYP